MQLFFQRQPNLISPLSPFPISFSLPTPTEGLLLGQSFLSLCRTFFWLLYWNNNYISRDLHLSNRDWTSGSSNTWDLGSTSHGCQVEIYCEFLAFVASRVCFANPSCLHFRRKPEEGLRAPWRKVYCIDIGRKYEDLEYLVIAR